MKKLIVLLFILMMVFAGGCSNCSSSGRKYRSKRNVAADDRSSQTINRANSFKVSMEKSNGVYFVPITINGVHMEFIFDTGASDITMSATEAMFLYKHGRLTDDDIIGTQQYRIADGSITEGTVVNLRKVVIGNKVLNNVKASIVHNLSAPLLLGQSALSNFGKVSIDYKKQEISFE